MDIAKTEFQFGRRQTVGNLEWGWKLDTSYQLENATNSDIKSITAGVVALENTDFANRHYEGSVDGTWKMDPKHLVEFLFDCSSETMKVMPQLAGTWPYAGLDTAYYDKNFKTHYNIDNYYFRVQDTMTLNKSGNLFFTPEMRAQRMNMDVNLGCPDFNDWKYSYGLGLKKVLSNAWTLRGTYGTYYKFPNFYEIFGDGVNVRSRFEEYQVSYNNSLLSSFVEHGTSWDVSANWQGKALKADVDVTLTYFNRHSQNLLTYNLDAYGFGYYTNLAAGQIQGLELEGKLNWQRWSLLQSATWNDSLITQSGPNNMVTLGTNQAGQPFPWIPKFETNTRLSYRFPGDKLTVFGEYHWLGKVGVYYPGNMSSLYEALGLTNVGLKYEFSKKVQMTAGVNDLFNKGPNQLWIYNSSSGTTSNYYVNNVQYPQQGRTYYLTVKYLF